ncbi:hypothetical protein Q7P37_007399 [Cladosporium fusiforme]
MAASTDMSKPAPTPSPTIGQLRKAIPDHCFQPSTLRSSLHVVFDLSLCAALGFLAFTYIPSVESTLLRYALWAAYGWAQGIVCVGIWILAHECGHGALFANRFVCDVVGWALHSMLMVPYFSWKFSHARHHRYTNHMEKDTAFVPSRTGEEGIFSNVKELIEHAEDAPIYTAVELLAHQLLGWPAYMFFYASGGEKSAPRGLSKSFMARSHYDFTSTIFSAKEQGFILLSDIGLALTLGALYVLSKYVGLTNVMLLYGVPYLWVNNWLVAITYLHHTHESTLHFEADSWTFTEGALNTVDRPYGFIGKYLFHGIIDCHVVHHLFTRIPFYHAEEATEAIKPVLGERYIVDDTPFYTALWKTMRSCRVVEASQERLGALTWSKRVKVE